MNHQRPDRPSGRTDRMIVHVLRESISPPEAFVWTMWCGDQCVADDEAILSPPMDFVLEERAERSDCEACKTAMQPTKAKCVGREVGS